MLILNPQVSCSFYRYNFPFVWPILFSLGQYNHTSCPSVRLPVSPKTMCLISCIPIPHSSEIEPYKVAALGRRIKKAYGWSIEWFSPEKPEPHPVDAKTDNPPESSKSRKSKKNRLRFKWPRNVQILHWRPFMTNLFEFLSNCARIFANLLVDMLYIQLCTTASESRYLFLLLTLITAFSPLVQFPSPPWNPFGHRFRYCPTLLTVLVILMLYK